MLDLVFDITYPPVCGICGRIDKNWLCPKCKYKIKNQIIYGIDEYNNDNEIFFKEHLYIFNYNGIIRNTIINYKFKEKSYIYKLFITIILKNQIFVEKIKSYDIIIPVPLSRQRMMQRGYNQSGLIAKELGRRLKVLYKLNVIKKNKNIVPQSTLTRKEREKNIKEAYIIKNIKCLIGKKVLIVDDVFTTGSTANECSKIAIDAGAIEVGILTIAKD